MARAAVLLRTELLLIERPVCPLTEEDRQWTNIFLREALKKSPVRLVARVLLQENEKTEQARNIIAEAEMVPYKVKFFEDSEKAKRWLTEGYEELLNDEGLIPIPLNLNLSLVRSELARTGKAKVQTVLPPARQQIEMTAHQPEQLQMGSDTVSIAVDQRLMSIRWLKSPHSRQYRYGMLKAIRAARENQLELLLLNNQRLGVLTLEDQGWLIATAQRMIPQTHLKKIAIVTSADALQQMSSDSLRKKLRQAELPLETRCFLSEEDAREWLLWDAN